MLDGNYWIGWRHRGLAADFLKDLAAATECSRTEDGVGSNKINLLLVCCFFDNYHELKEDPRKEVLNAIRSAPLDVARIRDSHEPDCDSSYQAVCDVLDAMSTTVTKATIELSNHDATAQSLAIAHWKQLTELTIYVLRPRVLPRPVRRI